MWRDAPIALKYHQQHVACAAGLHPGACFPPSASLRACAAGSLSRELHTLFGARRGLGASRRLQLFKLNRFPLSPLHLQPRQTQNEKMNIFQGKWRYWTAWLCPPEPGGDRRALISPWKAPIQEEDFLSALKSLWLTLLWKGRKTKVNTSPTGQQLRKARPLAHAWQLIGERGVILSHTHTRLSLYPCGVPDQCRNRNLLLAKIIKIQRSPQAILICPDRWQLIFLLI